MNKENINNINNNLINRYFRFFLSVIILLLMFYPVFGDKLLILNGIFLYFSYFLCSLMIITISILDFYELKKNKNNKNEIKENNITFILCSILIYIAFICGHYIFSPLNGIVYLVSNIFFINFILTRIRKIRILENFNIIDLIQRIMFYLSSLLLLSGNQPFEKFKLPISTTFLLMLNIITIFNIYTKITNEYEI